MSTDVLTGLLGAWQRAFDERRVADLVSLFTKDALFQGIGSPLRAGPAEIFGYYAAVPEGTTAQVDVLRGVELGEGLVGGFADVRFTGRAGEVRRIRLSVVAERVADAWLIRQYHAASHEP
ncbi:nuclear transport factor 2 family protein [Nonomuraea africana]|uniref:nuclear transport factor 2 family protein n=1 Tax=Nonomuraea africana TaxID=46171 RepID=UPI0033ED6CC9